jgi:hypothetical protein
MQLITISNLNAFLSQAVWDLKVPTKTPILQYVSNNAIIAEDTGQSYLENLSSVHTTSHSNTMYNFGIYDTLD